MRPRVTLVALAALLIIHSGFAISESSAATTSPNPFVESDVTEQPVQCRVTAKRLAQARTAFMSVCGGPPRDCDPLNGQWQCSSEVIGANAPVQAPLTGDESTVSTPGSCTVRGSTLGAARSAYQAQCTLPRRDCDKINGQWFCSSQQLGANAPAINTPSIQPPEFDNTRDGRLRTLISAASGGLGLAAFTMPDEGDLDAIPQDPNNPLTPEKVELGRLLFHDTAFALNGRLDELQSWSCATCHHAAAGFKSGTVQGIGNGGTGFGPNGADRLLAAGFDGSALADESNKPDLQPFASPSILHVAWQDVMLWNGQFGNSENGIVNVGIDTAKLATPGTPKAVNDSELSGVEVQAIAGSGVHRLKFADDTPLQTNETYRALWQAAYGNESITPLEGAGKAMAAFERTVMANRAPFQRWLRGDKSAMNALQKRGAKLFFGKAGCVDCHRGPGLGSDVGAMPDQMFFALGFNDIDEGDAVVHGGIAENDRLGRGGFTSDSQDNFKFKIPQLYNLTDANVMGHGGSFRSVRDVIEYKNRAIVQHSPAQNFLDYRFQPLGLQQAEINALTAFVADALNDPDLMRYQPASVPSGGCIIVDAHEVEPDGRCP